MLTISFDTLPRMGGLVITFFYINSWSRVVGSLIKRINQVSVGLFVHACTISMLLLLASCSEEQPLDVFAPNLHQDSQTIPLWKYGTPVTGDVKPIKWKPDYALRKLTRTSTDGQLQGVYEATVLLQDFMADVQSLIDDDPESKLADKLEKNVLKKAEDALSEMTKVPAEIDKARKKVDETGDELDKIIDDGLLDRAKGDDLHAQLDGVRSALNQAGGYEGCRGSKYVKRVTRNKGGEIHHCGHSVKLDKDALPQDAEMSIYVIDSEDVIVDFGPDGWFDKKVKIELNVEDMDLSGVDKDSIVLVWLDEETGVWYEVETKYDEKKNKLKADVWHFTQYSLSIR